MVSSDLSRTTTDVARQAHFRPDIQGLRAIAVLLVLAFHAGIEAVSGGYVGVDAFFVISGFLITTHLLTSLETEGRIRFGAFYAKRARRILPAAMLVAAITAIASWTWMSPLVLGSVAKDAVATALYLPNIRFAQEETDYLANSTPSVFQHYWSLGIEEQFYLFWPAVLAMIFWICRSRERRMMIATIVLTAGSFLACVVMMDLSQPWAFFSLPTRAWELGAGAILAFLLRSGAPWLRSRFTGLLAWVGLVGLLAVALTFDEGTPFPGWTASLPVAATALMIIGGAAPGGLDAGRVLNIAPMQFVGAISYSLYLVHWPLQVLPQAATFSDAPPSLPVRLLLGAAAVPLAWALYRFIEVPVIRSRRLREGRQRWTGVLAACASLALVASATGVHATSTDPTLSTPRTAAPAAPATSPTGTTFVPANLTPALADAEDDNAVIYENGCHRTETEEDSSGCQVGKNPDAPLVFLFGDSHAASWYPALEALAQKGEIRLDSNTKSSCHSLDIAQEHDDVRYTSCALWRTGVIDRINAEQPDLVILANFNDPQDPLVGGHVNVETRWQSGMESVISRISGPRVMVLADVPDQQRTPPFCLSRHLTDANTCAVSRSDAFLEPLQRAERTAASAGGAHHADLTEYLCNDTSCPTIIGNSLVYRDSHHLTATYSRQLAAPLWNEMQLALTADPPR